MLFQLLVAPLFSFTTLIAPAQTPPGGTLHWSASRPLVLADFKGRPRPGEAHAALTSATIVAQVACKGGQFTGHDGRDRKSVV